MAPRVSVPTIPSNLARLARTPTIPVPTICSPRESVQVRHIAQSYLRKVAEGEERWRIRAEKIENGELPSLWDLLQERGYVKDVIGQPERIKELMRIKRFGVYVGIDPTADSLHVGHLMALMPLFLMWFHGHPAATLIGGATGRIGDPTGRLETREIMANSEISKNITKMHYQLVKIWGNVNALLRKHGFEDDWAAKHHLLNNSMWLQGLTMYDFTKRLARYMRIGPMLGRETVRRKMTEGDGMSLGEFIYPLFQAWDWWHVYSKLGIQMQIGGSDQYGNLVAGAESFKILRESEEAPWAKLDSQWKNDPIGFTVPLVTDSSGAKLGKSAGNAVWLDAFKTSAFDLYGYFMRRPDEDVEKLLNLYTFFPAARIQEIMAEHKTDPSKRVAQHLLAFEVLSLVHGSQVALEEAQQHQFRFGGKLPNIIKEPLPETGIVTANTAPRSDIQLPQSVMKLSPARILFATGLALSNSDGQRLVKAEGAYVAGAPSQKVGLMPGSLTWTSMKMWYPEETAKFLIDDKLLILRKGKHNVRIVELVSDEEWTASGRTYPGQPYTGRSRMMKEGLREALKKEAEEKGETFSDKDFNAKLKEMVAEAQEPLTVSNNSDIVLPNKAEAHARAPERREMMRENKRQHTDGKR